MSKDMFFDRGGMLVRFTTHMKHCIFGTEQEKVTPELHIPNFPHLAQLPVLSTGNGGDLTSKKLPVRRAAGRH